MKYSISAFSAIAAIATVTVMTPNAAQAQGFLGGAGCTGFQLTLDVIVGQQCRLQVGDKEFSNFQATYTKSGNNYDPLAISGVALTGFGGASPGFDIEGGLFAGLNSAIDLGLTYDVSVLDPSQWLNGVTMAFNGAKEGTGLAKVTETVFAIGTTTALGQIVVDTDNPPPSLTASVLFAPVKKATINKDIFLRGGSDGRATISFIRNQHNQVPTPALLPGLLGIGFSSWRKRKSLQTVTA